MDKLFFNEEHRMLVEMARDFADNEITPIAAELDESESKSVLEQLVKFTSFKE